MAGARPTLEAIKESRSAMERTEHVTDALLRRILTEPSTAARLLLATADALDEQPFLNVTELELDRASGVAVDRVLTGLPDVVVEDSTMRAATAFPAAYPGETNGEYAIRLRDAARTV
jgi:hypothetical protein